LEEAEAEQKVDQEGKLNNIELKLTVLEDINEAPKDYELKIKYKRRKSQNITGQNGVQTTTVGTGSKLETARSSRNNGNPFSKLCHIHS
jgi:hypothetical protein